MQILTYSLFFYFIYLCNSFSLYKKSYNNMLLTRQSYIKLNMGCDYYIDKSLYIYDNFNRLISKLNLEHSIGYYSYYIDDDENDFDYEIYSKKILQLTMKPIVIYVNNTFCKPRFEEKYKKLIDYELIENNKEWYDVNKIIKKEDRYER